MHTTYIKRETTEQLKATTNHILRIPLCYTGVPTSIEIPDRLHKFTIP